MLFTFPSPASRVRRVSIRSTGQPLRSAYSRTVSTVQAPSAPSSVSDGVGPEFAAAVHGLLDEESVRADLCLDLQVL
jgi:hypothetical protein